MPQIPARFDRLTPLVAVKVAHTAAWALLAGRIVAVRDNFDIYLPLGLARHNKLIFGVLHVLGMAFAYLRWRAG